MKTLTINKALMEIEEILKLPNLDYVMVKSTKAGLEISSIIVIPDNDDSEALGDED